jgi:pre-mycofactocin synthase
LLVRDVASSIQSVEDARYFAQRRLPTALFQRFESGSGTNATMRGNLNAFEELMFRPRGGIFVPHRELRTTVLGHQISMPVIAAPVGLLGLARRGGEVAVARAAGAAGTIQCVSGAAFTPIEEIMAAATGPVFFQLYFYGKREASIPVIERVERAGCAALILNIDSAAQHSTFERHYRDRRNLPAGTGIRDAIGFAPQLATKPAWLLDFLRDRRRDVLIPSALRADGSAMSVFEVFSERAQYQQTPAWEDLPWIRERWSGPIIIKGVQTVDDARRAVDAGAAAIVVSNHGGNAIDGAMPTIRVLPDVVDAVGDRTDVMLDSGVRRGTDVVRALALGARAVLIGRAYSWALIAAGEPGVRHMLELFRQQIADALAFLGCASIHELDPSYVHLPSDWASE